VPRCFFEEGGWIEIEMDGGLRIEIKERSQMNKRIQKIV
jgi:hypothetical protein